MNRPNKIAIGFLFLLLSSFTGAQTLTAFAGSDQTVCPNDTAVLGGTPAASGGTAPYTYDWQPTTALNDPTLANPIATPGSPVTYTLTVTDGGGNTAVDVISISHLPLPVVNAGPDQTIQGGTNTQLMASGAVTYYWMPINDLSNPATASPTAEPAATTTFCVAGADAQGCVNFDCMILEVIPSDTIIIYNAFTPNGDDVNDKLFIGNLARFPDNRIEIFNRNGKLVYQRTGYQNDWDGKIDGAELPCATYYIVLDLGPGYEKKHGAVTIIR